MMGDVLYTPDGAREVLGKEEEREEVFRQAVFARLTEIAQLLDLQLKLECNFVTRTELRSRYRAAEEAMSEAKKQAIAEAQAQALAEMEAEEAAREADTGGDSEVAEPES